MAIREGKWKCPYCGTLNRGRDLDCTACGATRDREVKFIYDENAAEVTDEEQLRSARGGPDWVCETCGSSNPSTRGKCAQCGAPRGGSKRRDVLMVGAPPPSPDARTALTAAPGRWKKAAVVVGAAAAAGVVLLALLAFFLTRTHDAQLTVTGVEWQRSVEVEEFRTLTQEAWENEVPGDARVISRRREHHHDRQVQVGTRTEQETYTERVQVGTRKVKVGTRDLGNGYFEDVYRDEPVYESRERTRTVEKPVYRSEPVYMDKVKYEVDRWVVARTEQAGGQDNAPVWPQVDESARRRTGKRTEKYVVRLRDPAEGDTYEEEVSADVFARFAPGSTCRGRVNRLGMLVEVFPPGE
jgi:hypothetical protein